MIINNKNLNNLPLNFNSFTNKEKNTMNINIKNKN